jgi:hypothetical protein
LKRRFVGKPLAFNRDDPNGVYRCSLFATTAPLAPASTQVWRSLP